MRALTSGQDMSKIPKYPKYLANSKKHNVPTAHHNCKNRNTTAKSCNIMELSINCWWQWMGPTVIAVGLLLFTHTVWDMVGLAVPTHAEEDSSFPFEEFYHTLILLQTRHCPQSQGASHQKHAQMFLFISNLFRFFFFSFFASRCAVVSFQDRSCVAMGCGYILSCGACEANSMTTEQDLPGACWFICFSFPAT